MNRRKIAGLCGFVTGVATMLSSGFLASPISPMYREYHAAHKELNRAYDDSSTTEQELITARSNYDFHNSKYRPFFYKCAATVLVGFSLFGLSPMLLRDRESQEASA